MAEIIQALPFIQRAVFGGPDDPPKIMPPKKINPPPLAAQPKKPDNIPGAKDMTQAATIKDEKRRILQGLPKPTQNVFAGEQPAAGSVVKKRILGGSYGKQTTGVM